MWSLLLMPPYLDHTHTHTLPSPTITQVLTLSRDQFNALLGNLSQLRHVWRIETLRKASAAEAVLPWSTAERLTGRCVFRAWHHQIVPSLHG